MRILQLCKKSPTPQKDGESIAIHQITKALDQIGAEVDVLAMLTSKHQEFDKSAEVASASYQYIPVDTEISVAKALISIFHPTPYIVSRFKQERFNTALKRILQQNEYDFIILEGVFLGLYIKTISKHSKAKLVLRAHNVESQIWERLVQEENDFLKKTYLKYFMVAKFRKFEIEIARKVDAVVSISPIDNQYFINAKVKNALTVPFCVDEVMTSGLPSSFQIAFLGGMDWLPNRNGVEWFMQNVWRKFKSKFPKVVFQLAGRNFPKDFVLACEKEGVQVLGEIDNAHNFIRAQSLMIAPIFSGSGMRVKIIEAMSLGKTVLSTTVGAEGISYIDEEHLFIGNTPEEWLTILERLLDNDNVLEDVGRNASQLISEEYLLPKHAQELLVFLKQI